MPKQTRLDEHAAIYQQRKVETEKEKLKNMNFREKIVYLWEYYRIYAAIGAVVIALIVYFIYEIVTPDIKPQLYAAILDNAVDPDVLEQYEIDLAEYLQLDQKRQSVELNATFFSNDSDYALGTQQVLTTFMAAGEVDVIIAPETVFEKFAKIGNFAKLYDKLPTDIYSSLTDRFFISDTSDDTEKNAYGIYLDTSNLFKDVTYDGEPYVLGIIPNYPHEENTVEFIKYLFKK